jgi:hypothetical protein
VLVLVLGQGIYMKKKGKRSDGQIDAFDLCELHNSQTFLKTDQSDELS